MTTPTEPRPLPRRPLPVLRQTLTLCLPITVELIVLAEAPHEGDVTAARADVPELDQGGWSGATICNHQVYFRVQGG